MGHYKQKMIENGLDSTDVAGIGLSIVEHNHRIEDVEVDIKDIYNIVDKLKLQVDELSEIIKSL